MLTQAEIAELILPVLKKRGVLHKKFQPIIAREAIADEHIISITSSGKETENWANTGDFIVQNQTTAGEYYIVSHEKFIKRYQWTEDIDETFSRYKPLGKVIAVRLSDSLLKELDLEETFHFEAPWGEDQIALQGDYLVSLPDLTEVYRIGALEFKETYKPVIENLGEEE